MKRFNSKMMKFRPDRYHHDLAERRFLMLTSVALYIIFGTAMVFASDSSYSILNGYFIISAIMLANTGLSFLPGPGEKSTPFLFSLNAALVSVHSYGLMYFTRLDPTFTIAAAVITFAVMDAMIFVSVKMAAVIYTIVTFLLIGTLAVESQMNQWVFVGAMLPALIWRYFTHSSQTRLKEGSSNQIDSDQEKARTALVKSIVTLSNQMSHPIANIKIALAQIDASLGKNSRLKTKVQPSVSRIYKSVMKMNGILNGFKQFSRLNGNETFANHSLEKLLTPIVQQFQKDSFYRKFKIHFNNNLDEIRLKCQQSSLSHVFSEVIFLMTENITELGGGHIEIQARQSDDWVEVNVELKIDNPKKADLKTWGYVEYAHLSQLVGQQKGFLEIEPSEKSIRVKLTFPASEANAVQKAA